MATIDFNTSRLVSETTGEPDVDVPAQPVQPEDVDRSPMVIPSIDVAEELERRSTAGPARISEEAQAIRNAFRLAGLALDTAGRSRQWMASAAADAGKQVVRAMEEGENSADIAERAGAGLRWWARSVLGVTESSVREIASHAPTLNSQPTVPGRARTVEELRDRGDRLLARSADIYGGDDLHPAYERVLDELAPDEARILRFLSQAGPQPAVDIRTNRPLGIGSELIAGDLSSIADQAGCRYTDRHRTYIVNLVRLGLIRIFGDPVELGRYQLLEVQPVVEQAVKKAGRLPRIVRKSIALTDFGSDFYRTAFSLTPLKGLRASADDDPSPV